MLVELVVENYAVAERLRLRFHAGLNLLTGETGSGKSIVVDALGLLYGGRASSEVVRSGAEKARVAGIFEAPSSLRFRELLESNGIELEDGELLIEREVQANGKSRAFLGSRPVTAGLLRDLAPHLGDIHGQHDQQQLFSSDAQLDMLDHAAGAGPDRESLAELYSQWLRTSREMEELDRNEQEKLRLADLWSFQKREIEDAGLRPGEDISLAAERKVLLNVARLGEHAQGAYEALYDGAGSAVAQLRTARRRVEELCRIDPSMQETLDLLGPAGIALDEAAHALRHYLGHLEADPAKIEELESRLAAIEKLKRKYGGTVQEILAYLEDVSSKLLAAETAGERRAELQKEREGLAAAYEAAAARLGKIRRASAAQLEQSVEEELASLAMSGARFRIELTEGPWSREGLERVRFLISANAGEEARPLDKVASGGELSRIALALKSCLMAREGSPKTPRGARTLVFDEVDAGVGGRVAESVGRRLKKLAASNQVLCVTHLAQIAGFADYHYVVEKMESKGRTYATVEEITGEARMREIGRMLAGERASDEAMKVAEQLIKAGTRG